LVFDQHSGPLVDDLLFEEVLGLVLRGRVVKPGRVGPLVKPDHKPLLHLCRGQVISRLVLFVLQQALEAQVEVASLTPVRLHVASLMEAGDTRGTTMVTFNQLPAIASPIGVSIWVANRELASVNDNPFFPGESFSFDESTGLTQVVAALFAVVK